MPAGLPVGTQGFGFGIESLALKGTLFADILLASGLPQPQTLNHLRLSVFSQWSTLLQRISTPIQPQAPNFRVWGLRVLKASTPKPIIVSGVGFRVWGLGFRV